MIRGVFILFVAVAMQATPAQAERDHANPLAPASASLGDPFTSSLQGRPIERRAAPSDSLASAILGAGGGSEVIKRLQNAFIGAIKSAAKKKSFPAAEIIRTVAEEVYQKEKHSAYGHLNKAFHEALTAVKFAPHNLELTDEQVSNFRNAYLGWQFTKSELNGAVAAETLDSIAGQIGSIRAEDQRF